MTTPERRASRTPSPVPQEIRDAAEAAADKKAEHIAVLDLRKSDAFTDFFLICSGRNARQVHAIVDAVKEAMRGHGAAPAHVEGYDRGDWVLVDFFDFIVHVFTPETRAFYALERLWGSARHLEMNERGDFHVA